MSISLRPNTGFTGNLQNQFYRGVRSANQAIERLSTGKRINRPSDDPSGFVGAEQLRGELAEIRGQMKSFSPRRLELAERSSALSNFQTGLNEVRDRVVEASSGLFSSEVSASLQEQVDAAYEALDWISRDLGESAASSFVDAGRIDVTVDDTAAAYESVDEVNREVAFEQASVGIEQRMLDVEEALLKDREVIVTETISLIEDADFAEEAANLAISQTLTQAATIALVYSRQAHSDQIGGLLDNLLEESKPNL